VFAVAWIGFLCLLMVLGSIGEHSARGRAAALGGELDR